MASKTWVYTLNNYSDDDVKQLTLFTVSKHRCCKEVGDNNTPHLQGSITFKRAYRLSQLKKLNSRIHWESAKVVDSENYCTKGDVVIDVNNSAQGKRTDLNKAVDSIISNNTIREVAKKYPDVYVKYNKGLQALRKELQPRLEGFVKPEVIVYVGKAGTGKSRKVWENEKNLYNIMEPINGQIWFDGYEGQEAVLFDDFDYGWVKYHTLLQLLDGYPMQLPVKGSTVWKNWRRIYITTNKPPEQWYNRDEIDALKRRITTITVI